MILQHPLLWPLKKGEEELRHSSFFFKKDSQVNALFTGQLCDTWSTVRPRLHLHSEHQNSSGETSRVCVYSICIWPLGLRSLRMKNLSTSWDWKDVRKETDSTIIPHPHRLTSPQHLGDTHPVREQQQQLRVILERVTSKDMVQKEKYESINLKLNLNLT